MAEQVLEVVTTNAQNLHASDRAMLRLVSKQSERTVSENATKLTYEVRVIGLRCWKVVTPNIYVCIMSTKFMYDPVWVCWYGDRWYQELRTNFLT